MPIEKASMQRVADLTADVLVQARGDPTIGQRMVDYLRFGEAGPDRRKGTEITAPLVNEEFLNY